MENMNIYKDEKYIIYLTKDHWKALVVQLCRIGPKTTVSRDGQLVEDRTPYVVWQKSIPTISGQVLTPLDSNNFKTTVIAAIAEAKVQLAKLREIESMMDGVFIDFKHQCAHYNEFVDTAKEIQIKNQMRTK